MPPMSERPDVDEPHGSDWLALPATLAAGTLSTLACFVALRNWEVRTRRNEARSLAGDRIDRLRVRMMGLMEVLHSIASHHWVAGGFSGEGFAEFVRAALDRHPSILALAWNPWVESGRRGEFEARGRREVTPDFRFTEMDADGRIRESATRQVHVPVFDIQPLGKNRVALGYDLASEPARWSAIERARDTGEPVATEPLRLVQEPADQLGYLVLIPLYRGPHASVAERRANLVGFASAAFRIRDMVEQARQPVAGEEVAVAIFDHAERMLYGTPGFASRRREESAPGAALDFAGGSWNVVVEPAATGFRKREWQSWGVLGAGLALTAVFGAYVWRGIRRRAEIEAEVRERTKDLSAEIAVRERAEAELKAASEALEVRVQERTLALGEANEALQAEIRERKRAEDAAEAASRAKTAFLAHMSHEIRTPLNAILGYAQILQRDPALDPRQREAVATIGSSGAHLFGLIDDVLDLSKIESGKLELQVGSFSLSELIGRIEGMFQHRCDQKRLALEVVRTGDLETAVQGDEGKLRQVLINLLGNAVKFTDVGFVRLSVSRKDESRVRIEVTDSGPGIAEEDRERVFRPFEQTEDGQNRGGTGLGLSISERFIRLMGGQLGVETDVGGGSLFHFEVPLPGAQEAPPSSEDGVWHGHLAEGEAVKALVVDDVIENRQVLAAMLASIGCTVRTSASGEEALLEVDAWVPDIVFMDVWMPGAGGIATTQKILAAKRGIKVVAHSASAFEQDQKRYLEAGFDDFFAKPFRWDRVCGSLSKLLGVKFEADNVGATEAPADSGFTLSPALAKRLCAAAEVYNMTELRGCVEELEVCGEEGRRAAARIGGWMRLYDMTAISEFALAASNRPVAALT